MSVSESDIVSAVKGLTADSTARATLRATYGNAPPEVIRWIGQALLLHGLPFETLVPNNDLLPQESARFFFVDFNWLHSLVDGALSVGSHSSKSIAFYDIVRDLVAQAARSAALADRALRRGKTPPLSSPEDPPPQWTGLLLRSRLVSGWPGLEIKPYADAAGTTLVTMLRMERLTPDVMLCLFGGVPVRVDIQEPMEGLAFGGEEDTMAFLLRDLGLHDIDAGEAFDDLPTEPAVLRLKSDGTKSRVMNVGATAGNLQKRLTTAGAWQTGDAFGAASFALQLIKAPEQQTYGKKS